ncbi:hypothetical protein D1818_22760 [Aquimarina sp. BL5]|uniref:hypothetical protein n=1 Tax=Aquimarina sp. BL5 TaxID=1714860 RepID=UPI000E4868B4|nr:hypothetical protein [Aquimarina sp. BL5]AXT53508.1 hypothetical protein D1818_22760 [Aquimarina sp. BL5]RKN08010.1 hypothetical protein D7036_06515 [Aquimarina sp. BL5]
MRIRLYLLIGSLLILISCNTVLQETQNWIEKSNDNTIQILEGNYFHLENGLIKTFLPKGFKQLTLETYRSILDSSLTRSQLTNEMRRLESMRDMEGDFYLFFDSYTRSTYTLNTLPYMNFSKQDAAMLLSIIKQKNNQVSLVTDLNFKKLTAAYAKNKDFTMFRSIFQVDNVEEDIRIFSNFYIITADKQTFMINLTTPFEVNFDGYIEKMKF